MNWYDWAEAYDVLFGWDPGAERDFLLGASRRWGVGDPRRILEPFCGTGRLLRVLPGRRVGFDLNRNMLRFAARSSRVFRADASRFAVTSPDFDLAFCLVDSFRHLLAEEQARNHLACMARSLRAGAVYVLGLEVGGDSPADVSRWEWTMKRGDLRVHGSGGMLGDADPESRVETMHVRLDISRGGRRERVDSYQPLRVYDGEQLLDLIDGEGSFEVVTASRGYDLARSVALDAIAGSTVLVLRNLAR